MSKSNTTGVNKLFSEGTEATFRSFVEHIVAQIPKGRVMTYGQIAAICGNARSARIVGGIAHFGDSMLPWQRVVNKRGGLASGYPGGRKAHAEVLRQEGIIVSTDFTVSIDTLLWTPGRKDTEKVSTSARNQ